MKFENIEVYNMDHALRGMRNPKESWDKSDSYWTYIEDPDTLNTAKFEFFVGEKDLDLAQRLIRAGSEHRKFMRQIFVTVDITAPLYWWKEFDTYKVGTVANSTSTMHKLATTPITIDCFETDDYDGSLKVFDREPYNPDETLNECATEIIEICETLRKRYLETNDKKYWKELIRWLPESWLQTRTVTMDYENLLAMCSKGQRRFHKLTEWSGDGENFVTPSFIKFARSLPYAQEFIFIDELTTEQ